MAGLFDQLFATPNEQAMWALGSGLLGVRRGQEGQAVAGAMDAYNRAQFEQRRNALTDAHIKDLAAQEAQRKAQAEELKRKQQLQLQGFEYLQQASQPRYPVGATTMRPDTMAGGPQLPQLDPIRLIQAFGPEAAQKIMESRNWGRPEVSHWADVQGPQGEPTTRGYSKYGEAVGPQLPKYSEFRDPLALAHKTQIASAGAMKQMNLINAFEPFQQKLQGKMGEGLVDTYKQLQFAPATIQNIERAKALVPLAGPFVGSLGEVKLSVAKFLNNNLGMQVDVDGVKSAEELRSRIFFQIMDNLKKMDAQPSQLQQQIMMDALGRLGTDPSALTEVLGAFEDALRNKVALHNRDVQQSEQSGTKFPHSITIDLPQPATGGAPAVPPPSEIDAIRARRGLPPLRR